MAKRTWTDEQVNILKEKYVTMPFEELISLLNKSKQAIKQKAHLLSLIKERPKQKIHANDRFGRLTVQDIEIIPNRYGGEYGDITCKCDCGKITITISDRLLNGTTKSCGCYARDVTRNRSITHGKSHNIQGILLYKARSRAKLFNLECNIEIEDVEIPEHCPVLGIPLFPGKGYRTPNSPSVDRINSTKGYIKGNVKVISTLANRLKQESSIEDLEKFLDYIRRNSSDE